MAVSVSCNTWFSLWKSVKLILLNIAQMIQASSTRIWIFFKPHAVYFFSHESAFCAHETRESAYWSAWNSCKKYAASKIPGLVLTGSQSVINQPLMVEWEWIRHFCGLLTVSGWRRSPKWPERYASPSLPNWSKGSVEPLPLPPPPILFEGRESSVHRLRPKKTVFVKCREEYHTLSVERPWHWRVRRQFTLFIV